MLERQLQAHQLIQKMAHQKVLNPEASMKADEESLEEKHIVQPIIDLKSMPTMRDKNLQSDSDSEQEEISNQIKAIMGEMHLKQQLLKHWSRSWVLERY